MLQRNPFDDYESHPAPQEANNYDANNAPPTLDFTKIREESDNQSENREKSFEIGDIDDDEAAV